MLPEEQFPSGYVATFVDAPPDGHPVHALDGGSGLDATTVFVEVVPESGEAWCCELRKPLSITKDALTAVHATPHPHRACVVVAGDAYAIDVLAPKQSVRLGTGGPVITAHPLGSEGLLLLASPWVVTALDRDGPAWQTERLAIEGIRLDDVENGHLLGVADPADDEPQDFTIDLRTGRHQGGTPFR